MLKLQTLVAKYYDESHDFNMDGRFSILYNF